MTGLGTEDNVQALPQLQALDRQRLDSIL